MPYTPSREELQALSKLSEQSLRDIMEAIKDGAKHAGDALGFGPEALNSVEDMALAYYKARDYGSAAAVYAFIIQMDPSRSGAWRGLGACAHVAKEYGRAGQCYREAVRLDPNDLPSKVFLGECMCLVGMTEEGLKLLREVLQAGTNSLAYKPYLTRARAIVAAEGGTPPTIVLMREGKRIADEARTVLVESPESGGAAFDADREITWDDMQKNPELKKAIKELSNAIAEGRITYAQVGGFTDDELDGAYAIACQYCEMGEVLKSVQIAGYLIFLDPFKSKYYQLVGICLQRMKQYDGADYYYRLAQSLEADDVRTLIYRGESKILGGHIDAGLSLVRKGLEVARNKPEHQQLVERGQVLVKQFGA
jgi:tetratricopeptide (TPR) repeat protein